MNEIWKTWRERKTYTIEVSNLGRVKINNCIVNEFKTNSSGYPYIIGGYIHRIIAELFIPNPENKPCVDHIDTNKFNNRVDNLRWVTHKENSNNPLTRRHIGDGNKGKKYTVEARNKISIATRGSNNGMYGKHHNDETKNKIAQIHKTSGKFNGVNNPMYGKSATKNTVWINNGKMNKRIFIEDKINYPDFVFGKLSKKYL